MDFLDNLIARTIDPVPSVQPRARSRFEPSEGLRHGTPGGEIEIVEERLASPRSQEPQTHSTRQDPSPRTPDVSPVEDATEQAGREVPRGNLFSNRDDEPAPSEDAGISRRVWDEPDPPRFQKETLKDLDISQTRVPLKSEAEGSPHLPSRDEVSSRQDDEKPSSDETLRVETVREIFHEKEIIRETGAPNPWGRDGDLGNREAEQESRTSNAQEDLRKQTGNEGDKRAFDSTGDPAPVVPVQYIVSQPEKAVPEVERNYATPPSSGTDFGEEGMASAPSAPTVEITIGRVEVRAQMTAPPPVSRPRAPERKTGISLGEYLEQRNG